MSISGLPPVHSSRNPSAAYINRTSNPPSGRYDKKIDPAATKIAEKTNEKGVEIIPSGHRRNNSGSGRKLSAGTSRSGSALGAPVGSSSSRDRSTPPIVDGILIVKPLAAGTQTKSERISIPQRNKPPHKINVEVFDQALKKFNSAGSDMQSLFDKFSGSNSGSPTEGDEKHARSYPASTGNTPPSPAGIIGIKKYNFSPDTATTVYLESAKKREANGEEVWKKVINNPTKAKAFVDLLPTVLLHEHGCGAVPALGFIEEAIALGCWVNIVERRFYLKPGSGRISAKDFRDLEKHKPDFKKFIDSMSVKIGPTDGHHDHNDTSFSFFDAFTPGDSLTDTDWMRLEHILKWCLRAAKNERRDDGNEYMKGVWTQTPEGTEKYFENLPKPEIALPDTLVSVLDLTHKTGYLLHRDINFIEYAWKGPQYHAVMQHIVDSGLLEREVGKWSKITEDAHDGLVKMPEFDGGVPDYRLIGQVYRERLDPDLFANFAVVYHLSGNVPRFVGVTQGGCEYSYRSIQGSPAMNAMMEFLETRENDKVEEFDEPLFDECIDSLVPLPSPIDTVFFAECMKEAGNYTKLAKRFYYNKRVDELHEDTLKQLPLDKVLYQECLKEANNDTMRAKKKYYLKRVGELYDKLPKPLPVDKVLYDKCLKKAKNDLKLAKKYYFEDLVDGLYDKKLQERRENFPKVRTTVHAGEYTDEQIKKSKTISPSQMPDNVLLAAKGGRRRRIGHATKMSPEAIKYCLENDVPVEICPSSSKHILNIQNLADHPLRRFFDAGGVVIPNSDDSFVNQTTQPEECLDFYKAFNLTWADIKSNIRAAKHYLFLPGESIYVKKVVDVIRGGKNVKRAHFYLKPEFRGVEDSSVVFHEDILHRIKVSPKAQSEIRLEKQLKELEESFENDQQPYFN